MESIGKYLSEKRGLSDNFQGGDKKKKLKDGSSASYTDNTDVFTEGLVPADCKVISLNCRKNLQVKVKEIHDLANTTSVSLIKGKKHPKN